MIPTETVRVIVDGERLDWVGSARRAEGVGAVLATMRRTIGIDLLEFRNAPSPEAAFALLRNRGRGCGGLRPADRQPRKPPHQQTVKPSEASPWLTLSLRSSPSMTRTPGLPSPLRCCTSWRTSSSAKPTSAGRVSARRGRNRAIASDGQAHSRAADHAGGRLGRASVEAL